MNIKRILALLISTSFVLLSCKKDDNVEPAKNYSVPTTYNFEGSENNYREATIRLNMLSQLIAYAERGNITKTVVSKDTLLNMYTGATNVFGGYLATISGINLKEATQASFQTEVESWIDTLAKSSQSTTFGSNGVAGVVYRNNATTGKLYNTKGFAPYEIIEKGMMGALQLYQITSIYLSNEKIGSTVSKAERQKNWDLAFGYLGVPTDFPNNLESTPFWGEYFPTNNVKLGNNNQTIMNAFLKGRAAIDNDDNTAVQESAATIKSELEKTAVGMTLTYFNRSITAITNEDNGRRNGAISEALGFVYSLKFVANSKISATEIQEIIDLIGTNNWEASSENLSTAATKLAAIYGLDASKF